MADPIVDDVKADGVKFWTAYKVHIIVAVASLILGAIIGHAI